MSKTLLAPITPGVIAAARDLMMPKWRAIHHSDVVWNRSRAVPDPLSTAMCRHACALLKRALSDAQRRSGVAAHLWTVAKGELRIEALPVVPLYARHHSQHFVMLHREGYLIDATADQFGLDPLAIHEWQSLFTKKPEPVRAGMPSAVREWVRHPAYPSLIEEMGKSR